jgi:hypothetical protein
MHEWNRADANFATRVAQLKGTQTRGFNSAVFLTAATAHDDGSFDQVDILIGGADQDWFIYDAASGDQAKDMSSAESSSAIKSI